MSSELTIFKRKINLSRTNQGTIIYAIAISDRADENKLHRVSCYNGVPIGREIYDFVKDCYYVDCADLRNVGSVSFGYNMEIEGIANWSSILPLPEATFKPHLSEDAVQKLDNWKASLPKRWEVQYIQLASVF